MTAAPTDQGAAPTIASGADRAPGGALGPLRQVFALMQLAPRRLLSAAVLGALGLGSAIGLIAVSAWLIARASQMPPVLDLSVAVVAVRALGIGRALFRYLERLASHDIALRGLVTLRERLYVGLAAGDPRRALGLRRGDLLARLGADVDSVGDVLVKGVLPFIVAGIVCTAAALTSFLVLPSAGLTLLAALALAAVVSPWLAARAARESHLHAIESRGQISSGTLGHLESLDELRVAGALAQTRERLDRWETAQQDAIHRVAGWAGLSAALQFVAVAAAVVPALVLGSAAVEQGRIDPVMLAVITLLPLAAIEACATLPDAAAEIVSGRHAAERVLALLSDGPATPAPAGEHRAAMVPDGGVRATGLRVGWREPLRVPTEIAVDPGRFTVIVGPSGAGKTTLALTLAGLLPPLAGEVRVGGVRLADIDDLPRLVSFTAHDAHLFGTTIRENLLVAAPQGAGGDDGDLLLDVIDRVGLTEWLASLPDGLSTVIAPGGVNISGGERRRLLLARALLTGARVLILDEPTEHLDSSASSQVWAELTALAHDDGLAVVALTHDRSARADQVISL